MYRRLIGSKFRGLLAGFPTSFSFFIYSLFILFVYLSFFFLLNRRRRSWEGQNAEQKPAIGEDEKNGPRPFFFPSSVLGKAFIDRFQEGQ